MAKTTEETLTQTGLKRRTVIKGAAWSVPVIAAAVAVPAYASSNPPVAIKFGTSSTSGAADEENFFSARGVSNTGTDALIPDGSVITFTVSPADAVATEAPEVTTGNATITGPDAGGKYTITAAPGATFVAIKAAYPAGVTGTISISGGGLTTSTSVGGWGVTP